MIYSKRAILSRCNMQTRNIVLTVQKQSFVHNCTPSLHVLITYEILHDMNYNYSNTKSLPYREKTPILTL